MSVRYGAHPTVHGDTDIRRGIVCGTQTQHRAAGAAHGRRAVKWLRTRGETEKNSGPEQRQQPGGGGQAAAAAVRRSRMEKREVGL